METKNKIIDKLLNLLFFLSILIFTIGLNLQDSPPPNGWYQQWMPDLNGRQITDMFFNDSLNGFAVTNITSIGDTGYILKTTNGGDNWNFIYGITRGFTSIQFVNNSTGYASGGSGGGAFLVKTTNEGLNWISVNCPYVLSWDDMYVLNEDTLWLVEEEGMTGGVFRTTNGGLNWIRQLSLGSQNPTHIYFYNKDIGYAADNILYKTTNSGINWFQIPGGGYSDMYFINESTGWKCTGSNMRKTTDGGLNWQLLPLPPEVGNIVLSRVIRFDNLNADTIWGVGSVGVFGTVARGLMYITTNGGNIWGYQLPDTSINIFQYHFDHFTNPLVGWAYSSVSTGVHTITGGDTTIYLGVNQISSEIPKDYILYQNYPNPFNNETVINYELKITGNTNLSLYDISGKLIKVLLNERQYAGTYECRFNGEGLPSGVYFYRLTVDGKTIDTKKAVLLK